jgi:hypothetical protein
MGLPKRVRTVMQGVAEGAPRAVKRGVARSGTAVTEETAQTASVSARKAWADFRRLENIQSLVVRIVIEARIDRAINRGIKSVTRTGLSALTERDWASIGAKLTVVRTSERVLKGLGKLTSEGRVNLLSGHIREVLTLHIAEMQRAADRAIAELAVRVGQKGKGVVLDSSIHGAVELATKEGRVYKLGSDRIIGTVTEKEEVLMKFVRADGKVEMQPCYGVFEVGHVTEIKGKSNVVDAVRQHALLADRAKPGYILMGGRGYELRYDPGKVERVIIVPKGSERLEEARRLAKELKLKVTFIEYAEEDEKALQALTKLLLADLEKHS